MNRDECNTIYNVPLMSSPGDSIPLVEAGPQYFELSLSFSSLSAFPMLPSGTWGKE